MEIRDAGFNVAVIYNMIGIKIYVLYVLLDISLTRLLNNVISALKDAKLATLIKLVLELNVIVV